MTRRYISFVLVLILLSCTLLSPSSYVYASEPEQYGYIEICVNGNSKNYVALKSKDNLYLRVEDISEITGYNLNIGDWIAFSKEGNLDSITAVDIEFDGTIHAMGREYKIDIAQDGEEIFLPLNEMLYLLHSQWCMENDYLAVQPLPYTIIDFLGSSNLEYMWQNKVNQTDLLINGESELAHNLRSSLAAVFNDFDPMMFILWWPEEGMTPALNKEYEEALLQLSVDDKDFLDSYGQAKIAENLAKVDLGTIKSDFESMKNILDIPENLMDGTENIDEVVDWIAELSNNKKSIKFNSYSDASYMTSPRIRAWSKEIGDIADVLEIADLLINVSEVSQRSQHWGEDFINQISVLTNFDNMGYNTTIANRVKNVASNLIEEYQDPINAAADETALQTTALFLNKVFDESLFGKYFSIFNAGLAIAKTDGNIKNSIDSADLSYMVDCLIKVEQIAMNEMERSYSKILGTVINGDLTEQDIERLRNCTMLSLRANLRNHAFIYYLNEKLNDDSNWEGSTHAQDIQNQIINDYTLLCQVMETEPYDKLIVLDNFDNMYSDEYGLVRQKVTTDIFHEGELPSIDYNNLVTEAYTETYTDEFGTYVWRIPEIMLSGDDVESINNEIWETLFTGAVSQNHEGIQQGDTFVAYDVIDYTWAVNENILSLVITTNASDMSWTDYYVYNVDVSTGSELSRDTLLNTYGYSLDEYYKLAEQVLGSRFWSAWDRDNENFQNNSFVSWFNDALQKTISQENIDQSFHYINSKGELCIIAKIYSLAGADYYWNNLNMSNFTLIPDYATPVESNTHTNNIPGNGWVEAYKSILRQHPESTPFTYGSNTIYRDTEYTVYDIDKNGTPELIVKEDLSNYYVYSSNGTDVVASDQCYWSYDDCLYEYEGNGIVVHSGGMGSMRIENASLYSMVNNKLVWSEGLMSTEECSFDELYSFLDSLTPINDFLPITDYSHLSN